MEEPEQITDVQVDMSISRGDKPEPKESKITFDEIENLPVLDQDGNEIRFGDLYQKQKTIVIFLRHFLCFMTKEYVDDLAIIPKKYLEEAGVNLIVIGCADPKFIRPFRRSTQFRFPLYCDPDRKLYDKFGCLPKTLTPAKLKESKHIKSSFLLGVLKSTWRGMQFREMQGDMNQQGGAFIIGPGNVLHFYHRDQSPADHASINDLLALAGAQQVNFAKDTRVMTI